jgi:hypothetical protein
MFLDGIRADRGTLSKLPRKAFSVDQTRELMTRASEG